MAEKSRPQELVAPGASHQRPETQERSAVLWLSSCSLFTQSRVSAREWCHPQEWVLPSQFTQAYLEAISLIGTSRAFQVVKLKVNTTYRGTQQ